MTWLIFKLLLLFMVNVKAVQNQCRESRCSANGPPIRFPFRLKDNSSHNLCGYPGFELSCNGTNTVLELPISINLFVNHIHYKSQVIDVYDPDDCIPRKLSKIQSISDISPFHIVEDSYSNFTLFNCSKDKLLDFFPYPISCSYHIYAFPSDHMIESLPSNCRKMYNMSPLKFKNNYVKFKDNYVSVNRNELSLSWSEPIHCGRCEANAKRCRLKNNTTQLETECFKPNLSEGQIKKFVATGVTLGTPVLALLLIAAFRSYIAKKHLNKSHQRVERFLNDYKAMKPSRYSYCDIKHITDQFKDKLGEGVFGTVFKGKLSDSCFVAVKVLNNSKGDGEEFINEVGTIGQIHHINIVRLVGYCADGVRRALVYEFLPKGSLHQCISSPDTEHFLGWKNLYEIALGIAKGIEYLHQGCDQRILHFDIKPHNILLDENFTPKISDFGLAKLCSKEQSLVSMTTARGTMGYIAPEVFSRNFGKVSYKSDVYSFGMVLLEMVGGKKITDVKEDNTSQIYYPEWIYNLLEEGDDLRIHIGEEKEDSLIAKKLAIVGLWCIQWHPVDRPSMKTAVHMLEGGDTLIDMPPNPFITEGSRKTTDNKPKRRRNLELEAITEIE